MTFWQFIGWLYLTRLGELIIVAVLSGMVFLYYVYRSSWGTKVGR